MATVQVKTKTCTRCGEAKPPSEYYRRPGARDGLLSCCKTCEAARTRARYEANHETARAAQRRYDRRRRAPWALGEHERAEAEHPYVSECAICATAASGAARWQADHCHTTGLFRGHLCSKCNKGLGLFGDDPIILKAAEKYLRKALTRAKRLGIIQGGGG